MVVNQGWSIGSLWRELWQVELDPQVVGIVFAGATTWGLSFAIAMMPLLIDAWPKWITVGAIACFQIILFSAVLNICNKMAAPRSYPLQLMLFDPILKPERFHAIVHGILLGPMFSWWGAIPAGCLVGAVSFNSSIGIAEVWIWSIVLQISLGLLLGLHDQEDGSKEAEETAFYRALARNANAYRLIVLAVVASAVALVW